MFGILNQQKQEQVAITKEEAEQFISLIEQYDFDNEYYKSNIGDLVSNHENIRQLILNAANDEYSHLEYGIYDADVASQLLGKKRLIKLIRTAI